MGPGKVEVQSIEYPKLKMPTSETDPFGGKDAPHGVILKIVTTNICGSDQHMVRGRTTAPQGLILGHEITGEVIEKGSDVEMLNIGDLVHRAVQHRLRPLPQLPRRQDRHLPDREPGASRRGLRLRRHGRLGWRAGGVRAGALRRLQPDQVPEQRQGHGEDQGSDAACPTSSRPAITAPYTAGVGPGTIVYVAGAGPVGLACAASCHLLGAAVVIVGDMIPERLAQAKSFGCETIDLKQGRDAGRSDRADRRRAGSRLRGRLRRLRSARPRQ